MSTFEWNFEPRTVEFFLTVRAIFNPSIGEASVALHWIDGTKVSTTKLANFELDNIAQDEGEAAVSRRKIARMHPGASRGITRQSIAKVAVTMDEVKRLQKSCLPISVYVNEKDTVAAAGSARVHLGPLLLSRERDEEAEEYPAQRLMPCEVKSTWTETIGCAGLYSLELTVSTDMPVLSEDMLKRLLPACFTIDAVRGLPNDPKRNETLEDIYLEVYPATDVTTKGIEEECARTRSFGERPHNSFVRFEEPVVWLLGLADPHLVREWLQHQGLVVEVHDQDSRIKPPAAGEADEKPFVGLLKRHPWASLDDVKGAMSSNDSHVGKAAQALVNMQISRAKLPPSDAKAGDADEDQPPQRPVVVYPHGVARFDLAPLLEKSVAKVNQAKESRGVISVPLRADVFPLRGNKKQRRFDVIGDTLSTEGLLSDEGMKRVAFRTGEVKREDTLDYHQLGTTCTMSAMLALPMTNAAAIQGKAEEQQKQDWESSERLDGDAGNIWVAAPPPVDAGKRPSSKSSGKRPSSKEDKRESKESSDKPYVAEPYRVKLQPADGSEPIIGPWRRQRLDAENDEKALQEALQGTDDQEDVEGARALAAELQLQPAKGIHQRYEKYGRAVVVFQDAATTGIQQLLRAVRKHNADVLGVDVATAALEQYRLSEAQRTDSHLDLLTGFVVMDGQVRLFCVEGLRDGGMEKLLEEGVPRQEEPNSSAFKMLFHPEIGFSDRMYLDFGPLLKTIKIRRDLSPLEKLVAKPDLYSFAGKLAEDTKIAMQTPKLLLELKRFDRQRSMRAGASFPTKENIHNFEELYCGYLTDEEIAGMPSGMGQMKSGAGKRGETAAEHRAAADAATLLPSEAGGYPRADSKKELHDLLGDMDVDYDDDGTIPQPGQRRRDVGGSTQHFSLTHGKWQPSKAPLDQTSPARLQKSASVPDFKKSNIERVKERSETNAQVNDLFRKKRIRQTPFLDGQEVHIYSGQKFNSAELQKEWMRASMDPQSKERMWAYGPEYQSSHFEFSGAEPPGVRSHKPVKVNDTYARQEGDTRPPFRGLDHARGQEEYRKPARDLGHARGDELHEAFVENEWFQLAVGVERRRPLRHHVRFEPEKVPHHRVIAEQPFDPSRIDLVGKDFGPRSMYDSVHYHGEGAPGEDRQEENVRRTLKNRAAKAAQMKQPTQPKTFSQGSTRNGITDLDRNEITLKDDPVYLKKGFRSDATMKNMHSMRQTEKYHERGRPDRDFQARLRENDCAPPYDVATGTYMPRDHEVGLPRDHEIGGKRALFSGTLGKAPWLHGSSGDTHVIPRGTLLGQSDKYELQPVEYVSDMDFNLTRQPPGAKHLEGQLHKNASRTSLTKDDRKHLTYRRPADYGVRIAVT